MFLIAGIKNELTVVQKIIIATLITLGCLLIINIMGTSRVSAATVSTSTDCTLDESILSINMGMDLGDCISTGVYGVEDTINLPAGTYTLTDDLPVLYEPTIIQGAGMGQTIIDGDGQHKGFEIETSEVTVKDMTITGYRDRGLEIKNANAVLENIEIDGEGVPSNAQIIGIMIWNIAGNPQTLSSNNIYIHNFNVNTPDYSHAFMLHGGIDANISNTTLSDFHSTGGGGINGIAMQIGTFGGFNGDTTQTVNISNTTVNDVTSEGLTAPFNAAALASEDTSTVNATISNITITGSRGLTDSGSFGGFKSAAFYAAGAAQDADGHVEVNMQVTNSLMADNLNDGTSSNCAIGDMSDLIGGVGTFDLNIISNGYNLSDDDTCPTFTEEGDQQNLNNILSTLGPLQDNGGIVQTRALLAGSPAIGAGSAVLGISTDARGVARTASSWDVGAYQSALGAAVDEESAAGNNSGSGELADTGQYSLFIVGLFGLISSFTILAIRRI